MSLLFFLNDSNVQEVALLRCELEVKHRHLEGKQEALKILQGQVTPPSPHLLIHCNLNHISVWCADGSPAGHPGQGLWSTLTLTCVSTVCLTLTLTCVSTVCLTLTLQAILDKATSHSRRLQLKSEERTKALEKVCVGQGGNRQAQVILNKGLVCWHRVRVRYTVQSQVCRS